MWMTNPSMMCDNHLLGEHVEIHMLVGCIRKGKSLQGYINKGLVELGKLRDRHDELVVEMKTRGIKHKSPLPPFDSVRGGKVDLNKSYNELSSRCKQCAKKVSGIV